MNNLTTSDDTYGAPQQRRSYYIAPGVFFLVWGLFTLVMCGLAVWVWAGL